ncbi:MAG: (d)CMP kinase [Clostridia bacterium]|nr:(d)CMP kinase [Clostridia bacterium]
MFNIAIDGPAGAGKSTIAKTLAKNLGFIYVDTGALYRAVALFMQSRGITTDDTEAVQAALRSADIELRFVDGAQRVYLNGQDVSEDIRTPEVSAAASAFSAIPAVREFLFHLQQSIAAENDCIMDGRDIGTVVLPDADLKIFLTATAEDRAMRRHLQFLEQGIASSYEEVLADQKQRDYQDTHREISPLKAADDAIVVDTTGNEFEQSVSILMNLIKENLK